MREKLIWIALAAFVVAVFVVSGDGRYRYHCQDPLNWSEPSCQPPICSANKTCPHQLMGDLNVAD